MGVDAEIIQDLPGIKGRDEHPQQKLPICQGNMLALFIAFNWCKQINWSGSGASKTADACHLSHFMPAHETGQPGVLALHTLRTSSEIVKTLDNLKAVCMDTFQERYRGPRPFFADIFKDVKDQIEDEDPDNDIQHISIDYEVYNFQAHLVNWANQFTSEENEHMKVAYFRAKCLSALEIDTGKWRRDRSEADTSLGIKPAPPGHLFVPRESPFCAPGSPFCAPGSPLRHGGAPFCALGSPFVPPHQNCTYHLIISYLRILNNFFFIWFQSFVY